jgi:hypothetical protein
MLRKLVLTILLLSLYSCGFQVLYKEQSNDSREDENSSYIEELATIRIKKDRTRLSQEIKNNLYDLLNPDYIKAEPKYFLILTATKMTSPTFITITGASGRNRVDLNVGYELKDLESGDTISNGAVSANDNYNVTANRYGTYTSEEFVVSNLTKLVSQSLRNSLVNDLIELRKKKNESPKK